MDQYRGRGIQAWAAWFVDQIETKGIRITDARESMGIPARDMRRIGNAVQARYRKTLLPTVDHTIRAAILLDVPAEESLRMALVAASALIQHPDRHDRHTAMAGSVLGLIVGSVEAGMPVQDRIDGAIRDALPGVIADMVDRGYGDLVTGWRDATQWGIQG